MRNKTKAWGSLLLMIAVHLSCNSYKDLPTVPALDVERYSGTWYEIARLPNRFEKGLECVTATYTLRKDGRVTVYNRGHKTKDLSEIKEIKGVAWTPDSDHPARLKVRFFWPFAGDYQVIALDEEYRYALVGDPSRKYLWVLSRTPRLAPAIYNRLLETAERHGFDTSLVTLIRQDCAG